MKIKNIRETLKERGANYGEFKENCEITRGFMKIIEDSSEYERLKPYHIETFHMIFHKIARCISGDAMYVDNIRDIVGYATLLEDILICEDDEGCGNS